MAGNEPRPASTTPTSLINPRQFYLTETLGLSHDPFDGPVAEQELHSTEKEPLFFDYYIDPTPAQFDKSLLQSLREARNGLIFGPPGSGKTTLRYTLEAECRSVFDRILVVTYELSHKTVRPPTAAEHWTNIATELATDLFIQVIEQLDTFSVLDNAPTPTQETFLRDQVALIWSRHRLHRTVQLILADDFSDYENGLGALWPRLNRSAVRYIAPSSKINKLLRTVMPAKNVPQNNASMLGNELLKAGIRAVRAWGFEQILVLVDGVDAQKQDVEHMLNLISPLLDNLKKWQAESLFFYFFLNPEMHAPIVKKYKKSLNTLTYPPMYYLIDWREPNLKKMLHQRLWAAGGKQLPGLDALAAAPLEGKLEDLLLRTAGGSPRRLLQAVSALIDAHAENAPDQLLITPQDWQTMQERWSYEPPSPPDLI